MKKSIFLFVVILLSFFSITSANEDGNEKTNDITIEENLKAIISLQSIVGDYRQDGDNKIICITNTCSVDFIGESSTSVEGITYHWDFGNGISNSRNPQKKDFVNIEGGYTISLKITLGEKTDTTYFYIDFENILSDIIEPSNDENSGTLEGEETNLGIIEEVLKIIPLDIKYSFQSPTYISPSDEEDLLFSCDRTKDICKVNFNFEDTFTENLKKGDFKCEIDFGLSTLTGEEEKCNPNSVEIPIGTYEVKVEIINKNNENYFGELIFTIKNEGKMSQSSTTNYITYSSNSSTLSNTPKELDITTPTIKIQSGLDSNNECDKEKCSINFTYEPTDYKTTEIVCKWDFGEGEVPSGAEDKCNPMYVGYLPGKHKVVLEVCDENYERNCKNTTLEFENIFGTKQEKQEVKSETSSKSQTANLGGTEQKEIIKLEAKITLQGRQAKTKIIEENKITCFDVESCSINFTGEESIGEKPTYFWDFGNAETFEGKNPTSKIFDVGEYTTILDVTDNYGNSSSATFDIIVTGKLKETELEKYNIEGKPVLSSGNSEISELDNKNTNELKIEIQGKIGENKTLKGNKLTCIKTCSVNFDGSKSVGKFSSYFWDFGNGEVFEGKNPSYISYEKFGNYVVLFSAETEEGNLYEKEFYVEFIEKESSSTKKNNETSSLIDLSFADDEETDIIAEFGGIDYNEENEENRDIGGLQGKYIILILIIFVLGGTFLLLKRYGILDK